MRAEPENMHKVKASGVGLMAGKGSKRKRVSKDPAFEEGEPKYEVEVILDHRIVQKGVHYLVKWKGQPKESNTWEPEEKFANCKQMLRNYHKKCKVPVSGSASIGSSMYKAVKKFQRSLGYPTKEIMENMQTFSGRGGLADKLPNQNDLDKEILQLFKLPKGRRDPMAVQKIKDDLIMIREFHFKRQEQMKNSRRLKMK